MKFEKQKFTDWANEYANLQALKLRAQVAFEGWNIRDPQNATTKMREVLGILEEVITLVEKFSRDVEKLSSKKKLDEVVEFIDALVKVPIVLEWADDMVIRYLVSTVVEMKNKFFGKEWGKFDDGTK